MRVLGLNIPEHRYEMHMGVLRGKEVSEMTPDYLCYMKQWVEVSFTEFENSRKASF